MTKTSKNVVTAPKLEEGDHCLVHYGESEFEATVMETPAANQPWVTVEKYPRGVRAVRRVVPIVDVELIKASTKTKHSIKVGVGYTYTLTGQVVTVTSVYSSTNGPRVANVVPLGGGETINYVPIKYLRPLTENQERGYKIAKAPHAKTPQVTFTDFYLVEGGTDADSFSNKYTAEKDAREEAKKRSIKNPGTLVVVLQSIAGYRSVVNVIEEIPSSMSDDVDTDYF